VPAAIYPLLMKLKRIQAAHPGMVMTLRSLRVTHELDPPKFTISLGGYE
jgi:hypothetical protein